MKKITLNILLFLAITKTAYIGKDDFLLFSINAEDLENPSKTPNLFLNFSVTVEKGNILDTKDLEFSIVANNNIYKSLSSDFICREIYYGYTDYNSSMNEFYKNSQINPNECQNKFLKYFHETFSSDKKSLDYLRIEYESNKNIGEDETYHEKATNKYMCSARIDRRVTSQFKYQIRINGIVSQSGQFTSNVLNPESNLNMFVVSEMDISSNHEALIKKFKNDNVDVITFDNNFYVEGLLQQSNVSNSLHGRNK